jgi:hypothetical protein
MKIDYDKFDAAVTETKNITNTLNACMSDITTNMSAITYLFGEIRKKSNGETTDKEWKGIVSYAQGIEELANKIKLTVPSDIKDNTEEKD